MEESRKSISKKKFIVFLGIIFFIGYFFGRITVRVDYQNQSFSNILNSLEINFENPALERDFFSDVLITIKQKYYKQPVSEKDLFYGALKGLLYGLNDQYSVFFDPVESKEIKTELAGSFEGIGAEIGLKKGVITVIAPLEGTPAERAGLKSGDSILAINEQETVGISLYEAVQKIRGRRGTNVKLLIMRDGWNLPKDFLIKRDVINLVTVYYEMKEDDIAYLRLAYFNEKTLSEFEKNVRKIISSSPKGLIIDLRNNPGGYLYSAVEVAGFWTGQRIVVIEKGNDQLEKGHFPSRDAIFNNLPTIILVNNGSASGSEILAGALQDYGLAKILGEKTFGKGTVQELIELKDGSMIKITVAQWLTPNQREIEERGIQPDIELKIKDGEIEPEKDEQLEKAIELLKINN